MRESTQQILELDDSVIAHVAKLLQVALLTGTDIVDHMRMIRLVNHHEKPDSLVLEEEYNSVFNGSIDKMLENATQKLEESVDE